MWNKRLSILLSKALILVALLIGVRICFMVPTYMKWIDMIYEGEFDSTSSYVFAYFIIVILVLLLVVLYHLLHNISSKKVFVNSNTLDLRIISWCCFAVTLLFWIWSWVISFEIFIFVGFIPGFMGLIIRVVKNVMEEAISIREENDYTI